MFDTLLDEQTILGIALGASLAGCLPIPEIQYLAYLHNAEDQLRGEAASLPSSPTASTATAWSYGSPASPTRRASAATSTTTTPSPSCGTSPASSSRSPSSAETAAGGCSASASPSPAQQGKVCVFLEPIALYHERDLHDRRTRECSPVRTADREPQAHRDGGRPSPTGASRGGRTPSHLRQRGADVSARRPGTRGARLGAGVLDLQWLSPLPEQDMIGHAQRQPRASSSSTRPAAPEESAKAVWPSLAEAGYSGPVARLNSADSFVPLGPAASQVLVSEEQVVQAAREVSRRNSTRTARNTDH